MSENQKKLTAPARFDALNEDASRLSESIFYIVCSILVLSVAAFGAVDFWALGFLSIFTGLIAVLWIADAWFKKEFRVNLNALQIPLLGLILIGLIQLLPLRNIEISGDLLSIPAVASLSLAAYSTRLMIVQLIIYLVFLVVADTFVNNQNRLRKIVVTIIVFGSVMAFFGILQRIANLEQIYGLRQARQSVPFASYINQHHFAALMEMTVGITFALLFGNATRNNKRVFLIIAVVIMGVALVFTNSRGGMISLLGVIGFIIAANIRQKTAAKTDSPDENTSNVRRALAFFSGGLVLILALFGSVLMLGGDESLLRGIGLGNHADVSSGRIHFWQTALLIFRDYPIFGVGLDAFGVAFTSYDTWNGTFRVEQAHNDYLQILADAGILGFGCVAAFIFLLFKQGWRTVAESSSQFRRATAIGALAGCTGILIHSFFDFPLRTPGNAFFFLILTVLATASIYQPRLTRKKKKITQINPASMLLLIQDKRKT
ncbi:MAG: O-antigen ligase family protein [Pyrinomonadaceae bacterium]|nr:O-antigen ligase family protein [Pyrinomonadaceae bacterium]